ncbi:cytochrome P450 [Pleomassaria siparia CBS 279.74]|uniref:Cytochrome P450 n=1 Tax=Pleomassaria siparia CBS 279.74 TaxID=1314801 RepID=A0A6G1K882_9PLEO|nr:cytochrome P450 [Pleomassaria siparia CBS 279.74]
MTFPANIGASAAGILLLARLLLPFIRGVFSPLRDIPGPFAARFGDVWYLWRVWKGHFEVDNIALHRDFGPIVRYGPNRYSINDAEAQKLIYGHGAKFPKSSWYFTWSDPQPSRWSLFSDQNIKRHGENRRQYQGTYSMSSLVTYESYVDDCVELFRQRLQEIAAAGTVADMGHWLQCYAFDVIGLITYSKRLGFLDRGDDVSGVMAALEIHFWYATLIGIFSWMHPYLMPIRDWLAGKSGTGRTYVMKFTQDRIAEHESQPKAFPGDTRNDDNNNNNTSDGAAGLDFLSKFFAKHAEDPERFTMYHIAMGCVSNMVAGSDTTAISLSAILYYLLKDTQTFDTLRQEIDSYHNHQGTQDIAFKESQEMPYLQAVIKEALRMHPASGLPLERVVPDGGMTMCGYFFPAGTIVGVNTWVSHQNTSVFGSDAEQFNPSRWLIDDKEKLAEMERYWMPFGLGSRTCIGRHISMLEMSKLIPVLVRDFEFELHDELKTKEWERTNSWFVKPRGFRVKVMMREKGV